MVANQYHQAQLPVVDELKKILKKNEKRSYSVYASIVRQLNRSKKMADLMRTAMTADFSSKSFDAVLKIKGKQSTISTILF